MKKGDSINFIEDCEMLTGEVTPVDKLNTVLEVRTDSGTKTITKERQEYTTKSIEEQISLLNGYVAVRQSVRALILVVATRKKENSFEL